MAAGGRGDGNVNEDPGDAELDALMTAVDGEMLAVIRGAFDVEAGLRDIRERAARGAAEAE